MVTSTVELVGSVGVIGSVGLTGTEVLSEPPPHPVKSRVPVIDRVNSRTIFFFHSDNLLLFI